MWAATSVLRNCRTKYDAVVLCCGAKQARDITAPAAIWGIYFAVDYLTSVTRSFVDSQLCGW